MNISANGIAIIKRFEGFVGHAYKDAVGVMTIGYGHVILHGEERYLHAVLTEAEASALLTRDVNTRFAPAVTRLLGTHRVTQNQFDALTSLAFNIGTAGLGRSSVLRLTLAGSTISAAAAIRAAFGLWNKAGGRVLDALVKRRALEAALYLKA